MPTAAPCLPTPWDPLLDAISKNDERAVRQALRDVPLDSLKPSDPCFLTRACLPGLRRSGVVSALLNAGCSPDGHHPGYPPNPLGMALEGDVEHIDLALLGQLLKAGANPDAMADVVNELYPDPPSPGGPVWERALATGRWDVVETFLNNGWDPLDADHFSPLAFTFGMMGDARLDLIYQRPVVAVWEDLASLADRLVERGVEVDADWLKDWCVKNPAFEARWLQRQMDRLMVPSATVAAARLRL